jgi:hypothetical protein
LRVTGAAGVRPRPVPSRPVGGNVARTPKWPLAYVGGAVGRLGGTLALIRLRGDNQGECVPWWEGAGGGFETRAGPCAA